MCFRDGVTCAVSKESYLLKSDSAAHRFILRVMRTGT